MFRGRGFSLVEMMVVLVLIGLLAGLVTMNVTGVLGQGKRSAAKSEIRTFIDGLTQFNMLENRYPTSDEGLDALVEATDTRHRIIDRSSIPKDPWGNAYQYNAPGRNGEPFEVICLGADGREGGEGADADLVSWDLDEDR